MKNIDRTPDITSDEYWDTHHIAVVRVADVTPTPEESRRLSVKHRVLNTISDENIELERTTPMRHWSFGGETRGAAPVAPGDAVVVFYPRQGPANVSAVRLDTSPEDSALVNRLNRIARLRSGEEGRAGLTNAVFDPDRDVALYSLKRLSREAPRDLDRAFLARLRALADTQGPDPEIRMLANRIAVGAARGDGMEQELTWLESTLAGAQGDDWTRLRTLALRMLDFPTQRARVATFLGDLANDETKPQEVRIAAYSVFEDPRLFPHDGADDVSDIVFDAVERMTQSSDATLRQAGAMLLNNLAVRVSPDRRPRYLERARNVLQSAIRREKDPASTHLIQRTLDLLASPEEKR